jgi:hypothetical protein
LGLDSASSQTLAPASADGWSATELSPGHGRRRWLGWPSIVAGGHLLRLDAVVHVTRRSNPSLQSSVEEAQAVLVTPALEFGIFGILRQAAQDVLDLQRPGSIRSNSFKCLLEAVMPEHREQVSTRRGLAVFLTAQRALAYGLMAPAPSNGAG